VTVPTRALRYAALVAGALAAASLASETVAYRLGLVAIFFVGAIGLHILVNWAGELSLAHAAFVGLPAFAVAQVSSHSGLSPILALPVGVLVGVLLGLVVAVPALRARGLQVALVTLAVGIAIGRFFFVRSWVIGSSGGIRVPVPSLLGIRFDTSRSLLPVLAAVVLLAALAAGAILESKVGRALSLVRANPDAAAAMGIPVAMYRSVVYAVAGGFAGLAGYAYVFWVQRVGSKAFPLELGFTYLVIAVLAGKGGLTGLALSAALIEGGQVFSIIPHDFALYLGPMALIFNVTRYQEGFNGVLRETRERFGNRRGVAVMTSDRGIGSRWRAGRGGAIRLPVVVAGLLLIAGFSALALAWYHVGNTDQLLIQNQEIVSGGLGGLGLIVVGSMLLVRDALIHGRAVVSGTEGAGGAEAETAAAPAPAPVEMPPTELTPVPVETPPGEPAPVVAPGEAAAAPRRRRGAGATDAGPPGAPDGRRQARRGAGATAGAAETGAR
jgi:branched-chain amino acid transport system permease protein